MIPGFADLRATAAGAKGTEFDKKIGSEWGALGRITEFLRALCVLCV